MKFKRTNDPLSDPLRHPLTVVSLPVYFGAIVLVLVLIVYSIIYFYGTNAQEMRYAVVEDAVRRDLHVLAEEIRIQPTPPKDLFILTEQNAIALKVQDPKEGGWTTLQVYLEGGSIKKRYTSSRIQDSIAGTFVGRELQNETCHRPLFRYYDNEGKELIGTLEPSDVHALRMTLVLAPDPTQSPCSAELSILITPRADTL